MLIKKTTILFRTVPSLKGSFSCGWVSLKNTQHEIANLRIFNSCLKKRKYYASYHINCGVIQGFPALRKSRNNTREKISYFFTCVDTANQLLTCHSLLAPLGQSALSWIMAAKTLKFRIADRQRRSNFPRRGRKPIY